MLKEKEVIEQRKSKLRKKSLKKECSFKPDIGEFNRQLAQLDENQDEFLQRITNSKQATEEKINEKRQEIRYYEEIYDEKNNQELFKPKISEYGNPLNHDRKIQGYKNVYEALHEEARILKNKKQNLKKSSKEQNKFASEQYKKSKKNLKSDKILLKSHKAKLAKIFEMLDSDYDGYISAQKVDLSQLSNEILDILTPLLLKIEEHSLNIDFDQFVDIVLEFSQHLSITEKNILLGPDRELLRSPPEEHPFKPELSANTKAIIEFGGGDRRNVELWEDHRMRGSAEKENKELYECTFHPQILDYKPEHFRKGLNSKMGLKDTIVHTMSNEI